MILVDLSIKEEFERQQVYDSVRDVRRAVLMNRADEELDPDEVQIDGQDEYGKEEEEEADASGGGVPARGSAAGDIVTDPKISEEDKKMIVQQMQSFHVQKKKFDEEVAKWDDSGNDIVSLAKMMCIVMSDMTDFTRGRGRLRSTMDVINAAKKISDAGIKLDKAARLLADQCP